MKKLFLSLSVLAIGSAVCFAGPVAPMKAGKDKIITPTDELFRANEFDFSVFGEAAVGRVDVHQQVIPGATITIPGIVAGPTTFKLPDTYYKHHLSNAWGGGIEASYFFLRYLGIGIEGNWLDGDGAVQSVTGNLIGRYPVEMGTWAFAPYGFIGGGGQFDGTSVGIGQVGGGVEVRFNRHWGVFTDARWVAHNSDIDYALIRLGARFAF